MTAKPHIVSFVLAALISSAVAASAHAQTSASPNAPAVTDNSRAGSPQCAPHAIPPAGGQTKSGETVGQSREPLADKLAESDGVICPPAGVDPEIRAPAPDVGTMPVIPPPGSPGGDPNIRPK